MVSLCVGGRSFREEKSLLVSRSEFFAGLLNENWRSTRGDELDEEKEVFVDRNPDAFEEVLKLIRYPSYDFPLELWGQELDYFGVPLPIREAFSPNVLKPTKPTSSTKIEKMLRLGLRGASDEELRGSYCDRWFDLDPSHGGSLPPGDWWDLDPKWCHEVREMEIVMELSLSESLASASRSHLLENGVLADAVGPSVGLQAGGNIFWSCSGALIARSELLRGQPTSVDEMAESQRESLLAKYLFRRNADGNCIRSFRLRLPMFFWAKGEEENSLGYSADDILTQSYRWLPTTTVFHRWSVFRKVSIAKSSEWKMEDIRLRVLGRTYAKFPLRNVYHAGEESMNSAYYFPWVDWQTRVLDPVPKTDSNVAGDELPSVSNRSGVYWVEFRLNSSQIDSAPKDKFVFQLRVNGEATRISGVILCHANSSEEVEIYRATEYELLEDMGRKGWWPASPVYCVTTIGELRLRVSPLVWPMENPWDNDHLVFKVSLPEMPLKEATLALEVDYSLRSAFGCMSGVCGKYPHH